MHFHFQTSRQTVSSPSANYLCHAKKATRRSPIHLFCFLALFALASCGKDGPTRSTGPAKVVVTPNTVTLTAIGQSVQLDAQVQDEAGATLSGAGGGVVEPESIRGVREQRRTCHRDQQRHGGYHGHRGTEAGQVYGYGIPVCTNGNDRTLVGNVFKSW